MFQSASLNYVSEKKKKKKNPEIAVKFVTNLNVPPALSVPF